MERPHPALLASVLLLGLAGLYILAAAMLWIGRDAVADAPGTAATVAAFATLGISCILASRLAPARRARFALALVSTTLAFYAAELILSFSGEAPHRPGRLLSHLVAAAAQEGAPFDERGKREVVLDLRGRGLRVWPSLHPLQTLPPRGLPSAAGGFYPLTGPSESRVVYCNESGEWVVHDTDEHGFRNPPGLHRPGAVDLVLLGDSFTQGACVQDGEDLGARLRELGHAALNLGVGGHGPLLALATLTEYVEPLRPDTVLWFYFEGNDLPELEQELRSPILARYLEDGFRQGLASRQSEVDGSIEEYLRRRLRAGTYGERGTRLLRWVGLAELRTRLVSGGAAVTSLGDDDAPEPGGPFEAVLKAADARVRAWGGRLLVVYLPQYPSVARGEEGSPRHRRAVLDLLDRIGVPAIDLLPAMLEHPDPLGLFPFRSWAHYNADGYRYVATCIDRELSERDGPGATPPAP